MGLFRRRQTPAEVDGTEKRDLGVGDVHFPLGDNLTVINDALESRQLRLTPVFAAGRLLSTNIAKLPIGVYRKASDGTSTRLPLPTLFQKPSRTGTLHDWLTRAMTSLVYRGNAVGLVMARDNLEYPTRIEWLDTDLVTVNDRMLILDDPGSFTNPTWFYNGTRIPTEDILHIPWFTLPTRIWGLSPMAAYATTTNVGLSAQQFTLDWFRAGGTPPGTYQNVTQTVDQDEARIIKARLLTAIRSREPIVYGKDWKYEPVTLSLAEAAFVEIMQLSATQIANIYGIPPEMIGGGTGNSYTYSSPEQREAELSQTVLMPWIAKLEDAFSQLLPRGQYLKFNVDEMVRPDAAIRFQNYERARAVGLMNVDECRARENMPPLPNGQGQSYDPLIISSIPGASPPKTTIPAARDAGELGELAVITDEEVRAALREARYDTSPLGTGENWITKVGGLNPFIRAIAHALERTGHSESEAIQIAWGVVKDWAAGGGKVTPKTRAKAAEAVAEMEAKKAAAHAS